jgi:hypothetical protein
MTTHVMPFFKDLPVNEITAAHVRKWQSGLLAKDYAPTYLKTINNQLVAVMNYAVKYYGLTSNPCHAAGSMGKKDAAAMKFWTHDEFERSSIRSSGGPPASGSSCYSGRVCVSGNCSR